MQNQDNRGNFLKVQQLGQIPVSTRLNYINARANSLEKLQILYILYFDVSLLHKKGGSLLAFPCAFLSYLYCTNGMPSNLHMITNE